MDFKRAVLTGILLWVLIFFEVSILMFGFSLNGSVFYIVHYILLVFLVGIASWIYFKNMKGNLKEGLTLGIVYVIVGTILDLIITVPLFVKDYSGFFNLYLIIGLVETIIITSLVGMIKK